MITFKDIRHIQRLECLKLKKLIVELEPWEKYMKGRDRTSLAFNKIKRIGYNG